jgi:hypothetical protein
MDLMKRSYRKKLWSEAERDKALERIAEIEAQPEGHDEAELTELVELVEEFERRSDDANA